MLDQEGLTPSWSRCGSLLAALWVDGLYTVAFWAKVLRAVFFLEPADERADVDAVDGAF